MAVSATTRPKPSRRWLRRGGLRCADRGGCSALGGWTGVAACAIHPSAVSAKAAAAPKTAPRPARTSSRRCWCRRREIQLRLHEQARLRGRQRPDLPRRRDPRSQQGHLRPDHQAPARRGQRPADRAGRQDHLRRDHESQRRFPRRVRRFAAARFARPDPHGGDPRRPHRRQLHRVPERRLHRLRAVQGRPEEAAAVAGQGRPHHPRRRREDDLFRERAARILRQADRLPAVLLRARSDGEAQDRLPDADVLVDQQVRGRRRDRRTTGRWRRTTTSPSRR